MPVSEMKPTEVVLTPRSDDTVCRTCFRPFVATTFGGGKTGGQPDRQTVSVPYLAWANVVLRHHFHQVILKLGDDRCVKTACSRLTCCFGHADG